VQSRGQPARRDAGTHVTVRGPPDTENSRLRRMTPPIVPTAAAEIDALGAGVGDCAKSMGRFVRETGKSV